MLYSNNQRVSAIIIVDLISEAHLDPSLLEPSPAIFVSWGPGEVFLFKRKQYFAVMTMENHRKTIGKWWFHGILMDLPSGYD